MSTTTSAAAPTTTATSSDSTPSTETTVAVGEVDPEYPGPEKDTFILLEEPQVGEKLKFGFLAPTTSSPPVMALQIAFQEKVKEWGSEYVVLDASFDPQKQVSQFNTMLTMDVDAIAVGPIVSAALSEPLRAAKAAGIPVVSVMNPPSPEMPMLEGSYTVIAQGMDLGSYLVTKYVAEQRPGTKIGLLGTGLPVESVVYLCERMEYWVQANGLELIDRVNAKG